ncbi:Transcriptional regulatory protein OmpR [Sinobacterium norvegicum]|uniref:Transcriptional regulatory protein OmpR n=1 Tax=Sinobacterium norvegicum TaxID=1641715 RepID=A0ABM9AF05_9GAMM|nr:response regulator [Sinobacterium norvegicum]CAH0991773.1 Transcriptional regulatory protein OmpR [Sinobacterium norvegicum]
MTSPQQLLIVDDHQEIRDLVSRFLVQHNYIVTTAADGDAMLRQLDQQDFDLIILDVMMPGKDGLTLCRELRTTSDIPVIMLTAMGEDIDKIIGLEMGADDYLAKPFNPRELLARIKAILRRYTPSAIAAQNEAIRYRFDRWSLDIEQRLLSNNEAQATPLTTAEFSVLQVFVNNPNRVLSREQLLELAKGRGSDVYDRAVDTIISRLRKKLEIDPKNPTLIKTIWGGGYQFTCEVAHD